MIPIIDMHCDTISTIWENKVQGKELHLDDNCLGVDLNKLKKGGYLCQNFALYTNMEQVVRDEETAFDHAMMLSDLMDAEMEANQSLIRPALSGREIEENFKNGYLSGLKTIEEGAAYQGSVERLKLFYERGVRMSTLTWNYENELGFPNRFEKDPEDPENYEKFRISCDTENGLKPAGFEMVEAMEKLGVIIDLSHLNDAGIFDVFRTVKKGTPVVASHSNARSVTMHPRNLSDEMILKIAESGGVLGINFAYDFISDKEDEGKLTKIEHMLEHMKYIKNLAGIEVLGLGSDFDGIGNKVEVGDASGMQRIADAMSHAGFSTDEIEKVFYKNVLRVYKTVLG